MAQAWEPVQAKGWPGHEERAIHFLSQAENANRKLQCLTSAENAIRMNGEQISQRHTFENYETLGEHTGEC